MCLEFRVIFFLNIVVFDAFLGLVKNRHPGHLVSIPQELVAVIGRALQKDPRIKDAIQQTQHHASRRWFGTA